MIALIDLAHACCSCDIMTNDGWSERLIVEPC